MPDLALNRQMREIQSLDPMAHIGFSLSGTWFVSARIEISDGTMLTTAPSHSDTIEEAVSGFLARLREVKMYGSEYIISRATGDRIAYQWNGAAFTVVAQKAPTG